MSQTESKTREPLAIVGIGCRLPGGVIGPESYWKMLVEGRSGIVPVPKDRWNRERWYHENAEIPGKMVTKWGGFIDNFDLFDAQFFGISPREALRMDPQQRWLLETSWEALEDAGIPPIQLRGSDTAVFVGIASNDYAKVAQSDPKNVDVHTNSGSTLSIASNRISYLFDFKGPSVSVDTACSSALVAINLACETIWSGQSSLALAGGVNALLTPDASIGFSKASMLSPSGKCFAFDARANGYVRGEGAGMLVIKPLSLAQRDGDRVYCTIRSAVINQDGNTSSMTVPGVETQAEMLNIAYREAGMEPKQVRYMEAHGTGTPVGDPIETRALGMVLSRGRDEGDTCLIGSVKTNVGHLESGSGAAGLIKAALVLYHDTVPANLNFETPNPNIPFDEFKLKVADKTQPLPHLEGHLPVAAVNSFGFGGTNSHIVLEADPANARLGSKSWKTEGKITPQAQRPVLLSVSARNEDALRANVIKWRHYLRDHEDLDVHRITSAAGAKRELLDSRLIVVGEDQTNISQQLTEWLAGNPTPHIATGKPGNAHPLVFVFTGQGAQWWRMGQDLYQREPVFRRVLEEIDSCLKPLAGWSLIEEMNRDKESSQINRTNIAQPAIFGLQVALAELWKSWGIEPFKVVGHSVGEVAAAYVAGAYTMEDAVKVIFHRSRLQDSTGGHGRMVAVGLSEEEARKAIKGHEGVVEIAVFNSPNMLTLAGDTEPLEAIVAKLEEEQKFVRWLRIDYAFHTHQMEPIKGELLEVLSDIVPRATRIPLISTVTGGVVSGEMLDAAYWWRNVRESVLFAQAIGSLVRSGEDSFLELGPHPALQNPIMECLQDQGRKGVYFSSLKRETDESDEILKSLAQLAIHGYSIKWKEVNQADGSDVSLPNYAWQWERFWLESEEGRYLRCADLEHPMLGLRQVAPRPTWRFELDPRYFSWLDDHRFWDSVVFPASAYGEIGLAIARKLFPGENYVVEDLEMMKALFVSENKVPTVEIVFDPETRIFEIFSSTGDKREWDLNSRGILRKMPLPQNKTLDFEAVKARMVRHFDHQAYYKDYADAGYQFQPLFQHLQNVWRRDGESFAEIVAPDGIRDSIPDFFFHPAVLDACFHTVKGGQVIPDGAKGIDYFYLPAAIRSIRLYCERPPLKFWGHARVNSNNDREYIIADIDVYDDDGKLLAEIHGFRADRVEQKDGEDLEKCVYQTEWEPSLLQGTRIAGANGLASPEDLVKSANANLALYYDERGLGDHYSRFLPQFESIANQFIVNAYIDLGWKPRVGDIVTTERMMTTLNIASHYAKLVYGQFVALGESGILKDNKDGSWRVAKEPVYNEAVLDVLSELERALPQFSSEVELQRASGPVLAGVLNGEVDPLEVLFPGGSGHIMERFYREGADFPVINRQIRDALERAIQDVPERRCIRVLEVGAGTGSLTSMILDVFPPDRTNYVFTDNGPIFLQSAEEKFGEKYPHVQYQLFDCEKDPERSVGLHQYDIVIASNVIHATSDLKLTLRNLQRCLAPDGILLFLEVTWRRAALDNVFGLLSGWWKFEDSELREHSALLSRKQWESLLTSCGFRDVTSFISSLNTEQDQQACLVARAPDPVQVTLNEEDSGQTDSVVPALEAPKLEVYLVMSDYSGVGKKLQNALEKRGVKVVLTGGYSAEVQERLAELDEKSAAPKVIVHSLCLDHPRAEQLDAESLIKAQNTGVRSAHSLVKMLTSCEWNRKPSVFFLTRGTMPVVEDDQISGLASAPLTGLLRVANNEHADYLWAQVDLDLKGSEFEIEDLTDEILLSDGEHEVAFRGNRRYVRRVHRVKMEEIKRRTRNAVLKDGTVLPFRLQIEKPGILTNLSLNETPRRQPEPEEVEIQVKAGGINFRDVMKALGMYPGNPVDLKWFGDDFSGVITRVGSKVKDLKVGDSVVGMAPYCFRSYVTVHRSMVFRKPNSITHVDAATLPTVFLTAHYAINELGRMQKGESILIHAGTGGVGQAAIQIARYLGLTIFATAGSPQKRQLLKEMGVDHVLDSRSLEFADEIMAITNGEGVDAVLNSLAGDFIPKNFSVLKTFGRYMEIGKVDVYGNSKIGLEPLRNNISFFVIDLAQHLQQKPAYVAEMFSDLEKHFSEGDYKPLPSHVFPITQVVDAFRFMAAGKHVGKNVLDFDVKEIQVGRSTEEGHRFQPNGTYLITGGAGGFGLELALWMHRNGARHFALMSRSGPKDDVLPKFAELKVDGGTVLNLRGDVTNPKEVKDAVKQVQDTPYGLIGVINGAMVLDDEFIVQLDEQRFDQVLLPKMLGAWNLHEATLGIDLDDFICFSSFSAVIGAVKQSNYNAGNVFLDQLSHYRRARGLTGLTFNWGALTGAGFVARNEKTKQYLELVGLGATDLEETFHLFGKGIGTSATQLGCARCDWQALSRFSPSVAGSMFLRVVPRTSSGGGDSMAARILEVPAEKRMAMVEDLIAAQVAAVLGTEASRIDRDTPLTNLGLDSLMAIELVNRIEDKLGMSMPMGSVLNGPNIRDLSVPVLEKLLESGASGGANAGASLGLVAFEATGETPKIFPLSEGQKALWFLNRLAPESSAYNLVFSGKFRPLLDQEAMKKAFALLFERHPLFDVTFTIRDGEPVQVLQGNRSFDFREHDCSKLSDEQLKRLITEHANRPFNLERGPVVRLELFKTADKAHVALLSMHHIVSDAWSVAVMIQDLIEFYFSFKNGKKPSVEKQKASFADYVNWEKAHLESEAGDRMRDYWMNQMEGAPAAIDLPTDRPRPAVQTFNGSTFGFKLDDELTSSIDRLSKDAKVTLFTTLLSAYEILLHRYCQQDDIVVGVPLAGRSQPELQSLVGYFVNPVPVRSTVGDDPSILDYLTRNRGNVNGALENQHYPVSRLVEKLNVPRDPGRSPLFQVSFSMERIPGIDEQGIAVFLIGQGGHTFHIGDLSMETIDLTTRQAQFEITLVVEEAGGHLFGCWQYNRDLFDESTIAELNALYEQVLRSMVEHPKARISEIELLDQTKQNLILEEWNATAAVYPKEQLLHELVAKSASGRDDDTAVIFGDTHVTYGQLNRQANGIARQLVNSGVKTGDNVAVLLDRSYSMIAALLGVMKAGATYIPLDPEFPAERLDMMLQDATPAAMLVSSATKNGTPKGSWKPILIDSIETAADAPRIKGLTSDALAYIIYTSGSTGTPKGVEISHRAAINFLTSMLREPGMVAEDKLLAVTTLSFDISLLEMFLPLLAGATVVIAGSDEVKDGRRLANLLEEEDITVMQATPATWQMLLDSGWEGRSDLRVFCGGEALSRGLANTLVNSAREVWNLYGPTETTVWSAVQKIEEGEGIVTIGKPIANTRLYLLDSGLRPVPVGFTGELWIGGDGLARGYRNRPELTAAAFLEVEIVPGRKERIYRTGDLARWSREGNLQCLGRVDFQVKLRGVRIELGDIEAQMESYPGVKTAVVTKRNDLPGGEGLVGYFISEKEEPVDHAKLRQFLISRLPASYVPAYFHTMESFPLTPNKKTDRKRLPLPKLGSGDSGEIVAPRNSLETQLWDVFSRNFKTTDFGVTDNFFELGGNSLMALRILLDVSEKVGREVPVEAFLTHPTVEQLASYLDSEAESGPGGIFSMTREISLEDIDHIDFEVAPDVLPKVDSVALTYIPENLVTLSGLARDQISERLFANRPRLTNVYLLPQGKIGVIVLPCFESDFLRDRNEAIVKAPVMEALELAAAAGARTVSLTGVIPMATDYGRQVEKWIDGRTDLPAITTGDATRSATIVKSVEGVLCRTDREMTSEVLSVVGLGSIGFGTLQLMLKVLPQPKRIILCDPYQNDEQMTRCRDEIRAGGYAGAVDIVKNGGALPPEVYQASIIVASSNLPGILNIASLKPGTLVVDYSFPPVFKIDEAVKRLRSKQDFLFTTGGELKMPEVVQEVVYLPEDASALGAQGGQGGFLQFMARRDKNEITGCMLVSLLTGSVPSIKPTLGPVTLEDALAHYHYLNGLGIGAARLQMNGFFVSDEIVDKVRNHRTSRRS